jgi:hypothetical protein
MNVLRVSGLTALALLVAGCTSREEVFEQKFQAQNSDRIMQLTNLYCLYQQRHGQTSPADEAQLKSYVLELPAKIQERFMVDPAAIDDVFLNPRDGKPFKVRWNAKLPILGPSTPIVFEEDGVDGKFQVAFHDQTVEEVDQARYDELWDFDLRSAPAESRGAPGKRR